MAGWPMSDRKLLKSGNATLRRGKRNYWKLTIARRRVVTTMIGG
jgi:hypothetical protein